MPPPRPAVYIQVDARSSVVQNVVVETRLSTLVSSGSARGWDGRSLSAEKWFEVPGPAPRHHHEIQPHHPRHRPPPADRRAQHPRPAHHHHHHRRRARPQARTPRPDLRFAALRKLRSAGLTAGVLCCPLLPGINDSIPALEAIVTRAAAAGASFLAANPLFLKSCSRPTWLSFVCGHALHLIDDYTRRYATADFVDAAYRNRMASIIRPLCRKHRIGERPSAPHLMRNTHPQPPLHANHPHPPAHRAHRPASSPPARDPPSRMEHSI
jgi:hypothetical protein